MEIREARTTDYPAIGKLIRNELGYQQLDIEKLYARLDIMKSDKNHITIVGEEDGKVVGFTGILRCIAYNVDGECIQIIAMAVQKEHQNKGIGSKLLGWVAAYAAQNDIQRIALNSRLQRTDAHAFYEKNGYQKKSYGFYKDV